METLLPGLLHWTAMRETIGVPVHSAYVVEARTLIDPMVPPEGLEAAFANLPDPERIVLTNRLHSRHSQAYIQRFGCDVHVEEAGIANMDPKPFPVRGYRFGDEVAPGIVAHEVGVLTPEETALHVQLGPGALAFADSVIRHDDGRLGFFPDHLLGDDPAAVKRGMVDSFAELVDELDFDVLLLAHGAPVVGGGKDALRAFVAERRAAAAG